jgi:hypothetical protein
MRDESNTSIPFFLSCNWNLFSDASLITIKTSGFLTIGEPMISSDTITVQLAVPPLISAPYDGNQVTCLFSSIPEYARILPKNSIPWPPKPPIIILLSTGVFFRYPYMFLKDILASFLLSSRLKNLLEKVSSQQDRVRVFQQD